jgi:hypothetical protein
MKIQRLCLKFASKLARQSKSDMGFQVEPGS